MSSGRAEAVASRSRGLGGDGQVTLEYWPVGGSRGDWQAVTTVKPPRHRDRRMMVRGADPDDALDRLLRAMP